MVKRRARSTRLGETATVPRVGAWFRRRAFRAFSSLSRGARGDRAPERLAPSRHASDARRGRTGRFGRRAPGRLSVRVWTSRRHPPPRRPKAPSSGRPRPLRRTPQRVDDHRPLRRLVHARELRRWRPWRPPARTKSSSPCPRRALSQSASSRASSAPNAAIATPILSPAFPRPSPRRRLRRRHHRPLRHRRRRVRRRVSHPGRARHRGR